MACTTTRSPGLLARARAGAVGTTASGLNHDILCAVMEVAASEPKVICAMMGVCRALYHEGPRYLLALDIPLKEQEQIESYTLFLRAEAGSRTPLVRFLTLSLTRNVSPYAPAAPPLSVDATRGLADLIRSMPHLNRVRLNHINSYPHLCEAIADCTSIKHLTLYNALEPELLMLHNLRSSLLTCTLKVGSHIDSSALYLAHDPVWLLGHSLASLRSFQGICIYISLLDGTPPCFSNLKTLSLHHFRPTHLLHMRAATHYFPNLARLRIYSYDPWSGRELDDHLAAANNSAQQSSGRWRRLQEVKASMEDLHASGLECQVTECLHVVVVEPRHLGILSELLTNVRAPSLTLYFDCSTVDRADICRALAAIPRSDSHPLRELWIITAAPMGGDSQGILEDLAAIADAVTQLPLVSLTVELYPRAPVCEAGPWTTMEDYMGGLTFERLAGVLHSHCPHIEHVLVAGNPPWSLPDIEDPSDRIIWTTRTRPQGLSACSIDWEYGGRTWPEFGSSLPRICFADD